MLQLEPNPEQIKAEKFIRNGTYPMKNLPWLKTFLGRLRTIQKQAFLCYVVRALQL